MLRVAMILPLHVHEFLTFFGLPQQSPSVEYLTEISRSFIKIPYENWTKRSKNLLTKNTGENCRLPHEVWEGYKKEGFGGTCFSLTYLLRDILQALGFVVQLHMAHRSYGENTHCALTVHFLRKKFLLDPGFLIPDPLELHMNDFKYSMPTGEEIIFIVKEGGGIFEVWSGKDQQQKMRYCLNVTPIHEEDFIKHWKESFHFSGMDNALFTQHIGNTHIYLRDQYCRIVTPQETVSGKLNNQLLEKLSLKIDKYWLSRIKSSYFSE